MKHGKRPTLKQLKAIRKAGLNPTDWLTTKSLPGELHIQHRYTGKERVVKTSAGR